MRAIVFAIVILACIVVGVAEPASAGPSVECQGPSVSVSVSTSAPPSVMVTPPTCTVTP